MRGHGALFLLIAAASVVCLALGCSSGTTGAEEGASEAGPEASPVVHVLPPMFADEAGQVEHEFPVVNRTGGPVTIRKISPSCSCSSAWTDAKELDPGGETTLHVRVNLAGRTGPFDAMCEVANDSGDPWVYTLRTTIYERVAFTPKSLQFGTVSPGQELTAGATVSTWARGEDPPTPGLSGPLDSPKIDWTERESSVETLPSEVRLRKTPIRVRAVPAAEVGVVQAALQAKTTDSSGDRSADLRIAWAVSSPYVLEPQRVFFAGPPGSSGSTERAVTLRRTDGRPIRLVGARSTSPAVKVRCEEGRESKEIRVFLALDGAQVKPFLYGELSIETEDERAWKVTVPFAAAH